MCSEAERGGAEEVEATELEHRGGILLQGRNKHMVASINGDPQNGWFIRGHPIEKDDLGVPPFQETPIWFI